MKRKKYYFALGNLPAILVIIIIIINVVNSDNRSLIGLAIILFPLFYLIFIHTSVTFYEHTVRFKVGVCMHHVEYAEISRISEMKWSRPGDRNSICNNAHVFFIRKSKPVGIEHLMFSRETTIEIVDYFEKMKKNSKDVRKNEKHIKISNAER